MPSSSMLSALLGAALLSLSNAHGVILGAQGEAGSPASVGFQVDAALARNCTNISPCQQDTTIIRDAEINANIVNQCGRTEISGNIDVGENTENQLAANAVTQVKAGTIMKVTIHQVNADGAGPYTCDLDQSGNTNTNIQNLTVTNNIPGVNGFSQAKTQDFIIDVAMPDNLACTGASTGNVCTVRCRNNALAGPFGGCFAVQQSDVTPGVNTAETVTTAQTKDGIDAQVAQDKKDIGDAIQANQNAGTDEAIANKAGSDAVLAAEITSKASPTQTLSLANVNPPAAAATGAANAGNGAAAGGKAGKAGNANAGNAKAGNANAGNNAAGNGANASASSAAGAAATGGAATGNAAKGNAGNAATGNAATGNAAKGNAGNAATGNAATGKANNAGGNNNNNNDKRWTNLRWARRAVV